MIGITLVVGFIAAMSATLADGSAFASLQKRL